jgi:hypothetical protein
LRPQGSAEGIVAGQTGRLEVVKTALSNVRFGSKADISVVVIDVRFTPESGHRSARRQCPLWTHELLQFYWDFFETVAAKPPARTRGGHRIFAS